MPQVDVDTFISNYSLEYGAHDKREDGMCAMEAAAWLAGEPHSDHPRCVSPVLGAFLRNWNDSVDEEFRQKLKPFIPRVLNTSGDGKDEIRAWMATDWLVRICAPAWLDLAKLTQHAMALRAAEQIRDTASAERVQPIINASLSAATAAADDAWDAAADDAWDAAWVAAADAAWDAAGDAVGVAAADAARAAARASARAAARAADLHPTVENLQYSALELLDRMIAARARPILRGR